MAGVRPRRPRGVARWALTAGGYPGVENGWILTPGAWNQGYATEIGLAVRDHASIAVAQRLGATLEGEHELNGIRHLVCGQFARRTVLHQPPT